MLKELLAEKKRQMPDSVLCCDIVLRTGHRYASVRILDADSYITRLESKRSHETLYANLATPEIAAIEHTVRST